MVLAQIPTDGKAVQIKRVLKSLVNWSRVKCLEHNVADVFKETESCPNKCSFPEHSTHIAQRSATLGKRKKDMLVSVGVGLHPFALQ